MSTFRVDLDYGAPGHDGDPDGPGHRDTSEDHCWTDRETGAVFHYCNALRGKVTQGKEVIRTFDPSA